MATVLLAGGLCVAGGALPGSLFAQQKKGAPAAKELTADQVHKPGDLPDIIIGNAEAPVTIVEYASMTCPHCATFHTTVLPTLKQKYVDTGQVRFIFREFPLDNVAAAASMLARCAGGEQTAALVAKLFETQEQWAFVRGSAVPALLKVAESAGITQETFDKCLKDEALLAKLIATRERGSKELGVSSTPSFFINGKRLEGRADQIATFEQAIEPLLKK